MRFLRFDPAMRFYKILLCSILICYGIGYPSDNSLPLVATIDNKEICIWMQIPASTSNAKSWALYQGAPETSRVIARGTMEGARIDKIVTKLVGSSHNPLIVLRFFDENGQPSATYLHRIESADDLLTKSLSESASDKWVFLLTGALLTLLGGISSSVFQSRLQKKQERANKHDELRQAILEQAAIVFAPEMLTEVDSEALQELIRRTAALSYFDRRASILQKLLIDIMILQSGAEFVDHKGRFQMQYENARVQWRATVTKWP